MSAEEPKPSTPSAGLQSSGSLGGREAVDEEAEKNVLIRGADTFLYRRSVQLFFVNEEGQFLLCCPIGDSNRYYRQTMQGGSQVGESPMQTAAHEAWEEIGLDLAADATFLLEVLPLVPSSADASPKTVASDMNRHVGTGAASAGILATDEENAGVVNAQGELVCEYRAAFCYRSKHWRGRGIRGQEMYPMLFLLPRDLIDRLDVRAARRGVRQEFRLLCWGPLSALADCAPPVKKHVMATICPAVAAAAMPFLTASGTPLDGVAAYLP